MKKLIPFFAACTLSLSVHAADLPGIPEFIDEMVAKHHFNRAELSQLFVEAQHRPSIIDAITRPATKKPWGEYRAVFVNPQRVKAALAFWQQHRVALQRAEQQYGVPQEIILGILGVETLYGKNMGNYRVLDALTTLAFDYPKRAPFFRSELENYLLLTRDLQLDRLDLKGSYAGAIGIPQFMPSSYRKYAVDFNDNHKTDLRNEAEDAIGSVANYLHGYGWQANEAVAIRAQVENAIPNDLIENKTVQSLVVWAKQGVHSNEAVAFNRTARVMRFTMPDSYQFWLGFNNFDVITRYNTSDYYALSVFELAEAIRVEAGR
jgi:membrane-bound lytic murein transglycosylase B